MQLTDEQKQSVSTWIAEGMKLAEIQQRLDADFNVRLTYMEARFLVDDLKLTPKDPEPPAAPAPAAAGPDAPAELSPEPDPLPGGGTGKVNVQVDKIMRPGAMVSGNVTFSDGVTAGWYLDQTGRIGMIPTTEGYRPPQEDVAEFQKALDRELQKMGY